MHQGKVKTRKNLKDKFEIKPKKFWYFFKKQERKEERNEMQLK